MGLCSHSRFKSINSCTAILFRSVKLLFCLLTKMFAQMSQRKTWKKNNFQVRASSFRVYILAKFAILVNLKHFWSTWSYLQGFQDATIRKLKIFISTLTFLILTLLWIQTLFLGRASWLSSIWSPVGFHISPSLLYEEKHGILGCGHLLWSQTTNKQLLPPWFLLWNWCFRLTWYSA